MSPIYFRKKFTGAQASLFARICEHYSDAAESVCNDTPAIHPLFSWLSPQQRIQLVSEVAVGLLCPDEPLPPHTPEHIATYLSLIATIKCELGIELDDVWMRMVGDDFMEKYYDDSMHWTSRRRRDPEDQERRGIDMKLIGRKAEKNREKLDREQENGNDETDFVPQEHTREQILDRMQDLRRDLSLVFGGPPCSENKRLPPRSLTDDEKCYGFQFRLLDRKSVV